VCAACCSQRHHLCSTGRHMSGCQPSAFSPSSRANSPKQLEIVGVESQIVGQCKLKRSTLAAQAIDVTDQHDSLACHHNTRRLGVRTSMGGSNDSSVSGARERCVLLRTGRIPAFSCMGTSLLCAGFCTACDGTGAPVAALEKAGLCHVVAFGAAEAIWNSRCVRTGGHRFEQRGMQVLSRQGFSTASGNRQQHSTWQ
jgi:hypothetical protein